MKRAELLDFEWSKDGRGAALGKIAGTNWREYCCRNSDDWSAFCRETEHSASMGSKCIPRSVRRNGAYWSVWGDYAVGEDGSRDIAVIYARSQQSEIAKDGSSIRFRPIYPLKQPTLYLRLVNSDTPEKLRIFVQDYGMPFVASDPWTPISALQAWRDAICKVLCVEDIDSFDHNLGMPMCATADRLDLMNMDVSLVIGDGPTIRFRPRDFVSAVWYQLSSDVLADARLKRCPECEIVFGVGPNTNRNRNAVFCSRTCQNAAAYARRKTNSGS